MPKCMSDSQTVSHAHITLQVLEGVVEEITPTHKVMFGHHGFEAETLCQMCEYVQPQLQLQLRLHSMSSRHDSNNLVGCIISSEDVIVGHLTCNFPTWSRMLIRPSSGMQTWHVGAGFHALPTHRDL